MTSKPGYQRSRCPVLNRYIYTSEQAVQDGLRDLAKKAGSNLQDWYACDFCGGYHVTSKVVSPHRKKHRARPQQVEQSTSTKQLTHKPFEELLKTSGGDDAQTP